MSSLDIIMVIVIIAIVCFGSIFAHCAWINEADVDISCKLWAEQWDDLDKQLKYSKLGLIYPPNNDKDIITYIKDENLEQLYEEKARVLDNMMCSSKEFEKVESIVANPLHDDIEPKSKKLQPLLCKMCGGTVAKKGDNYECEYCGLRYEWR